MYVAQYRAAQQRFAEVRSIANSFLFEVYDSLADQPGATQARMLLARRAQQYLDELARDRSSDPALRRELAGAIASWAIFWASRFTQTWEIRHRVRETIGSGSARAGVRDDGRRDGRSGPPAGEIVLPAGGGPVGATARLQAAAWHVRGKAR
jgi:hypothetical protein